MRRIFQWLLIAVPLVLGILIGMLVWLVMIWWRALVRGYTIGRLDEHS